VRAAADALAPGPARRTVLVDAGSAAALGVLPGCGNFGARLADSLGINTVLRRLGLAPAPAALLLPLVHGILDTLDIRDSPAAVDTIHTRLQIDPAFLMAEVAFLDTPEFATTLQDVRSAAEQLAKSRP